MSEKVLVSFEVDNAGAIKKVKQFRGEMGEVPASTAKAAAGLTRLKKTLLLVGTAFAALGVAKLVRSLTSAGGAIIRTGAMFETMAIQMRAVTGSSEAAQKATDWIVQFTADTPYQLEQVTNAFVKMRAMGLDPMDGTMQAVADMTSFLGGSMDTMNSIVLALGKSYTVGKISMEEMRMMMERGVPVIDILADKLGVTNEVILEMSQKGKLGREAIQLLIEGMGELAGGASRALMESYTGMWSNLQDHITLAMKEMSEGGALEGAKAGLRGLIDVLEKLRESGKLAQWGAHLGKIFNAVAQVLVTAIENFDKFLQAYYAFVGSFWQVTSKIARAAEMYVKLSQAMTLFANDATRQQMEDLRDVLGDLAIGAEDFGQAAMDSFSDLSAGIKKVDDMTVALAGSGGAGSVSTAGGSGAGGLAGAFYTAGKGAQQLLTAGDNFYSHTQTYITGGRNYYAIIRDIGEASEDSATSVGVLGSSFSNLLGKGFMGELETFADLWDAIWQDLAKSMTGLLGDAFEDAFSGGGNIFENLKEGWSNFKVEIEKNPLGAGLAGAGMVYSGMQQGGSGGIIAGALGGMMTGASIGSVVPAIGTTVGAIVGAIVGAATAYFGQPQDSRASAGISISGGYASASGQSAGARNLFVQERVEEYRASIMMMNDVLRMFGDGELFDLIGGSSVFEFDGAGTLDNVAAIFRDRWLPSAMRQMFKKAINRGLGSFGVDAETRKQLWAEVSALTGTNQIVALETFIGSVINLSHLYDDMNWNAILDESRQDSLTAFLGSMGEVLDAVQMQMIGLDSMTLLERAEQATTIEQLILQARQAEIQMLMQIDALQDSINRSIDSQIEGLRTGGMSDPQLRSYYGAQIDSLMSQLRGGVDSPEAIQQIMADLQRYVGAYQGALGDDLYTSIGFGGSYADQLISILEEARGLSNDALETMRDQIRESNDALVLELQRLIEALTHYGDTIATADQAPPVLDGNINIDVNVYADEGFGAWVDTRIERWEWRNGAEEGPN